MSGTVTLQTEKPKTGVFMGYNSLDATDPKEEPSANSQIGIIKGISQSVTVEDLSDFNVHFSDGKSFQEDVTLIIEGGIKSSGFSVVTCFEEELFSIEWYMAYNFTFADDSLQIQLSKECSIKFTDPDQYMQFKLIYNDILPKEDQFHDFTEQFQKGRPRLQVVARKRQKVDGLVFNVLKKRVKFFSKGGRNTVWLKF